MYVRVVCFSIFVFFFNILNSNITCLAAVACCFQQDKLEICVDDVYPAGVGNYLDMPKRPAWNYSMSTDEVKQREEKYFKV